MITAHYHLLLLPPNEAQALWEREYYTHVALKMLMHAAHLRGSNIDKGTDNCTWHLPCRVAAMV